MRKPLLLALVTALAVAGCERRSGQPGPGNGPRTPAVPGAAPTSGAAVPPARQPGLWQQTVSSEGRTQVSRICLDAAVEKRFAWWGAQGAPGACRETAVTPKAGGGWSFSSACDLGAEGRTTTSGVVTGDFARRYVVEAQSTTVGAQAQLMNGVRRLAIEAAWQGPCPPDMKPGDVSLPGGLKINILKLGPARHG